MTIRHRQQTPLGKRLLVLRQRQSLTQEGLARRAGLSKAIVQSLEQGLRQDPKVSTLVRLAGALGVSLDVLAGLDSRPGQGSP